MKRILTIQDLSCLGKCSLSVALPVLSAMGCACTALPTAVLSTHTAFPAPHCHDMTTQLVPIAEHWKRIGAEFDAVSVGYLSDPRQAGEVARVLELFGKTVVLDPVMGDNGTLYARMTREHVAAMQQLCRRADYLLPNVTEASYLTGIPYRETADETYLQSLAAGLLDFGVKAAVITGFTWEDGQAGFFCADRTGHTDSYRAERIPKHLHGTGDLFAAVFTGALALNRGVYPAAELAAGFVERVVLATPDSSPFGAEFEYQLPWLMAQLA